LSLESAVRRSDVGGIRRSLEKPILQNLGIQEWALALLMARGGVAIGDNVTAARYAGLALKACESVYRDSLAMQAGSVFLETNSARLAQLSEIFLQIGEPDRLVDIKEHFEARVHSDTPQIAQITDNESRKARICLFAHAAALINLGASFSVANTAFVHAYESQFFSVGLDHWLKIMMSSEIAFFVNMVLGIALWLYRPIRNNGGWIALALSFIPWLCFVLVP